MVFEDICSDGSKSNQPNNHICLYVDEQGHLSLAISQHSNLQISSPSLLIFIALLALVKNNPDPKTTNNICLCLIGKWDLSLYCKNMPAAEDESRMCMWSREEDKQFEKAIAKYGEPEDDCSEKWDKISAQIGGGKSVEEVKHHYELLVDDVKRIESGIVDLPCYNNSSSDGSTTHSQGHDEAKKFGNNLNGGDGGAKSSRADQERRKGIAWTEDEHRLFLLGLDKYGKGDWRSISRNFVVTRTPTQVASHAQKYFIRLNSMNKERRRSSIHDITSVNNGDVSVPQGPITGQTNGSIGGQSGKPNKQGPQVASGLAMYGPPTIGQPIGAPLVSAVGTPVNIPPPPHLAYGVPGTPMNMGPMSYHPSTHR